MRTLAVGIACAISLAGCAVADHKVVLDDLQQPPRAFVVDRTQPDSYPAFLRGEDNGASCRYGIHHESTSEFSPSKAQLFAKLLSKAVPSIATHEVVLERFDVYYNHRLLALHSLGTGGMGGLVPARQNTAVFTFDKLLIDTDPDTDRHPYEDQVGCKNRHEGEYYRSEVGGVYDVVVTWLKFTVDGHPYYFRTFYQLQPENYNDISAGIKTALQTSLQAIAPRIQL